MLDYLAEMNEIQENTFGDPEVINRISQYEMAFRMQTSVTDVMNLDDEPDHVFQMYGADALTPGTFAANCLLFEDLLKKMCGLYNCIIWMGSTRQSPKLPNSLKT